jgi:hypothetical protein
MAGTMRTTLAVAALSCAALAAGCGSSEPDSYSPEVQDNFVTSCVDSATSSTSGGAIQSESQAQRICGCMYDELQANVPFEEFKQADDALRNGEQLSGDVATAIQNAAQACT